MKHNPRRNFLLLALIAAVFQPVIARDAAALDYNKMMRLEIYADDRATKSFGRLRAIMQKLRRAGHGCRVDSYAYGGGIDCGDVKEPQVLMGFIFAPTRSPEFLIIHSIRAKGINGGEMAKEKFDEFLEGFLKPAAKPAK